MIGNTVASIDDCAFNSCLKLTSVIVPNSVTNIGRQAFVSCTGLTNVIIGKNVACLIFSAKMYRKILIFKIHLLKRALEPERFDLGVLAEASAGFSGSEIEQAIVSSMYTAHAAGRIIAQEDLLAEIKQTRPLSVLLAERVTEIREWATERTVPCD